MNDDLIKRLLERPFRHAAETEEEAKLRRQSDREEAAAALAEAQAEIARLEAALQEIAFQRNCEAEDKRHAERDAAEWQRQAEKMGAALRGLLEILDSGSKHEPQVIAARAALSPVAQDQGEG